MSWVSLTERAHPMTQATSVETTRITVMSPASTVANPTCCNLGDSSQRHDHRWHPVLAIMRLVMVRRQGPAVVRKDALAAMVRCLPCPGAVSKGQRLRDHVPRVIKEVGAELISGRIVSDNLQPAHVLFSDTAVRRVHDKAPTWPPLVDIAPQNPH